MAENKTKPTDVPVADYVATLESARRREESDRLIALLSELSGEPAVMWGPTMIGFGRRHYVHDSGRTGEIFRVGFAPRKAKLVLYANRGFEDADAMIAGLGKCAKGAGCLYFNRLDDIDLTRLAAFIRKGLEARA